MDDILLFLEEKIRWYQREARMNREALGPKEDWPNHGHYRIREFLCIRIVTEYQWLHDQLTKQQQPPTEAYHTTSITREMDDYLRKTMGEIKWKADDNANILTRLQAEIAAPAVSKALSDTHDMLHRLADAHKVKLEH